MSDTLYEKVIYENEEKGFQLRITYSTFKEAEYFHIRKYFMSYDEGYLPSKEGVAVKASLNNIYSILEGVIEVLSIAESKDATKEALEKLIAKLNEQNS